MSFSLRRHPGLVVLLAGLLLGGLADGLFRAVPWGLNVTLLASAILVALLVLPRPLGIERRGQTTGVVVAVVAASSFLGRDTVVLAVLDGLLLLIALAFLASIREATAPRSLVSDAVRVLGTFLHSVLGPPLLLFNDIQWAEVEPSRGIRGAALALRGLLLALPILLVFTLLLSSADAVFALRVHELFQIDFPAVFSHLVWTTILAWLSAGFLRAALLREEPAHRLPVRPDWLGLGPAEIAIVLALVDLLFSGFVWIQLRYLFGGSSFVESAVGPTYAQYARTGFFELVTVATLVLLLLLVAHWLLDPRGPETRGLFAALAGVQVLLVFVMLASAYERMRLYRAEFGLTELRFYTTAFMLWLGILLAGFLATVLRGHRDQFARLVTASALAAVAALHAVDPEAQIVRTNASAPRGFDLCYALRLGADSVPALLEALPTLGNKDRGALADGLLRRWGVPEEPDWRTWNASRSRARRLVREAAPALEAVAKAEAMEP